MMLMPTGTFGVAEDARPPCTEIGRDKDSTSINS